jgi:hypothetical protein
MDRAVSRALLSPIRLAALLTRRLGRVPMKIAQIAPLIESVPPRLYGGTERIVSYLTEELVAQGHDVTLFASGDSLTSAKLVPCCPQALVAEFSGERELRGSG